MRTSTLEPLTMLAPLPLSETNSAAAEQCGCGCGCGVSPGEWPPLRHAASARVGSGAAMAGTVTTGHPRLSHCWSSQSVQS